MRDLRFWQQYFWEVIGYATWHCVVGWFVPDVSKECSIYETSGTGLHVAGWLFPTFRRNSVFWNAGNQSPCRWVIFPTFRRNAALLKFQEPMFMSLHIGSRRFEGMRCVLNVGNQSQCRVIVFDVSTEAVFSKRREPVSMSLGDCYRCCEGMEHFRNFGNQRDKSGITCVFPVTGWRLRAWITACNLWVRTFRRD